MNLPIKKSPEQIEYYKKFGPSFGRILKSCYEKISKKEINSGKEVENYFESCCYEFFPMSEYCFSEQQNSLGEYFNSICCVSINDSVGHQKPSKEKFKNTDIISIDFGIKTKKNLCFDGAFTVSINNDSDWWKNPLKAIKEMNNSFLKGTNSISAIIENTAVKEKVNLVTSVTGHGIGSSLHETPKIYNAVSLKHNYPLIDNLVFCVEPVYVKREFLKFDAIKTYLDYDGWTIKTVNKQPASHFETMFAVENGKIIDLLKISEW